MIFILCLHCARKILSLHHYCYMSPSITLLTVGCIFCRVTFVAFAACLRGSSHISVSRPSRWSFQGDVTLIWLFWHQFKVHSPKGVVYPQCPVYSIFIFCLNYCFLQETYNRNMLIQLENCSFESMLFGGA